MLITDYRYWDNQRFDYTYRTRRLVAPQHVHDIFNDNAYYYRTTVGKEFEQFMVYQGAASERYRQPPGTASEVVLYHKAFAFVAEIHCYIRPDTTDHDDPDLGASGKADARELIHEDEIYYVADRPRKPDFSDLPRRAARRANMGRDRRSW